MQMVDAKEKELEDKRKRYGNNVIVLQGSVVDSDVLSKHVLALVLPESKYVR